MKLLNDCELTAWDGFHGKHPSGVKDGIMFSLQATVNNGRKIKAEGSGKFSEAFQGILRRAARYAQPEKINSDLFKTHLIIAFLK